MHLPESDAGLVLLISGFKYRDRYFSIEQFIFMHCNCTFFIYQAVPTPGEWTQCAERECTFQENKTWSNAERTCQSYGGHLAGWIDSTSFFPCAERALQTCFRDGPQINTAYVGMSNILDPATYRWVRDNSYNAMLGIVERRHRHCGLYSKNGYFGASDCTTEYPFICERGIC